MPNSFYKKTIHNYDVDKKNKTNISPYSVSNDSDKCFAEKGNLEDREFFDIFGIRLYYDDILLISLIFVLYNEGVDDTGLFIALILLLLS